MGMAMSLEERTNFFMQLSKDDKRAWIIKTDPEVVISCGEASWGEKMKKMADKIMGAADSNRDGVIDFEEFLKLYTRGDEADEETKLQAKEKFDAVDGNGDGKLTWAECVTANILQDQKLF